tara:strand:+ start:663 stop:920 length:258 start_codon:yes stop_codon:yes gene_type:complete
MLRNFFKRNRSLQPPLGRWRIGQKQDVVDEKVRRSNEDHCGADLCQGAFVKDAENNVDKNKKENTVKTKISNNVIDFDPLLPFCI